MRSTPLLPGPLRAARALCLSGALGISLAGCVADNEAIVFVAPSIEDPSANVEAVALGTSLTGSFRLTLKLGPRASGPSQVSVQKLALANADQSKALVEPLEAKADMELPITVEPDSEKSVLFTIDFGASVLPPTAGDEICAAGGLTITGTIADSLEDSATPVASSVFTPTGCP